MLRTLPRTLVRCAFFAVATLATVPLADAQTFVEYPTQGGRHRGITTGPDGNLWVTSINPNQVLRMTTSGSFAAFDLPTVGAWAIAAGPDGLLWFTEPEQFIVGQVSTSGVVKEFAVPFSGGDGLGITTGSDDNLWFTAPTGNAIGRVTTNADFTSFAVPTTFGYPTGIAAGADGNLWFTESEGDKIGRLTTSGTFTEFVLPNAGSVPYGIAPGADGRMWFTESQAARIGAIAPDGTIKEYPIPSGGFAQEIAAAPDGRLYFTESTVRIGRIAIDGSVTEYAIPNGVAGYTITAGPDGAMWFTQTGRVVRFDPNGVIATPTPNPTVTPTPTATATSVPLNAFGCYQSGTSKGAPKLAGIANPPGLALVDRFGGSLVALQKPKFLCAPTAVNGDAPTIGTFPEYLDGFQIKNKVKPHFPRITVVDRFNASGLVLDLKKQAHLFAPVVASLADPNPLATPSAFSTDAFTCYQAKVAKGTPKFVPALDVPLADAFGAMTVDVTKPAFYCAPTSIAGGDPAAAAGDEHLMCYKAKQVDAPKFTARAGVAVNGRFGAQTLDVKKPALLCVTATVATAVTPGPDRFCDLPGSVRFTEMGTVTVPGGDASAPTFLHLPQGFCAHAFANVGNPQQLRFAPGGELFVASPTTASSTGGPNGQSAILVLPDDDRDGIADATGTFLPALPSTQGLLFANGFFYYQDGTTIRRVLYTSGDRTPSAASAEVADVTVWSSSLNWQKALDVADDGTIYVTNGSDQSEPCDESRPFHGGVLALDGSDGGAPVTRGMRMPSGIRCARGSGLCFATEQSKDFAEADGARSKIVPIRSGDDWGYACCASQDLPFSSVAPTPDCSAVAAEDVSLAVTGHPNDLDFAPATWPAPWNRSAFVSLLGATGSWTGARVIAIRTDATTGALLPASDLGGMNTGAMADFATGWDDMTLSHGRPTNVAFAADGRLFIGNGSTGDVIWIAPFDLPRE